MNDFQPQQRVTTHFDTASNVYYSWYHLNNLEGHSFRIRKQRCMEALNALPAGSHIADIGCGPATMIQELLDKQFNVTGTDIAPGMIEECNTRFPGNLHTQFIVCSADATTLPADSQDAVTAMGLMEYLNDEPATLKEFHRITKPNGLLLVTYPHYWSPSRIWNRFTHLLLIPVLAVLRRGQAPKGVKHREYCLAPTVKMIQDAGYTVEDVIFYNFKLGFRPFDTLFPTFFVKVAETLEKYCRMPFVRRIGTGFIVCARKKV